MNSKGNQSKKPTIWARLLRLLMENKHLPLSTIFLKDEGFPNSPQNIWYLKRRKGIRIKTEYRTVTDANGDLHTGIACYSLKMEV